MDKIAPEQRSANMRRIRSKNTLPEMIVRKTLYSLGYRYRLHARDLPGKPDIVFRGKRKAIFVHGCFWHQHGGCREAHIPKSNKSYWEPKLKRNVERDKTVVRSLREEGWEILTVWECETTDQEALTQKLTSFMNRSGSASVST